MKICFSQKNPCTQVNINSFGDSFFLNGFSEIENIIRFKKIHALAIGSLDQKSIPQEYENARESFRDCLNVFLNDRILKIIKGDDLLDLNKLILLSLLDCTDVTEVVKFEDNATNRNKLIKNSIPYFLSLQLEENKNKIYSNYCHYLRKNPVMLTEGELGCLAKYWKIGLTISFNDGRTYESTVNNSEDLKIILCNPSLNHWQVEATIENLRSEETIRSGLAK
jgi:hypothetical protein